MTGQRGVAGRRAASRVEAEAYRLVPGRVFRLAREETRLAKPRLIKPNGEPVEWRHVGPSNTLVRKIG